MFHGPNLQVQLHDLQDRCPRTLPLVGIFSSENGTPVNPGNALRRYVQPAARDLGIKLSGWHDFRHTLATGLIQSGVPTKTVSEILGHANVGITLNTYTHPVQESFRGPLNQMAELVM